MIGKDSPVDDNDTDYVFREPMGRRLESGMDTAPDHLMVSEY